VDLPSETPSLAAAGPISYAILQLAKAHRARAAMVLRDIGLYPGQELLLVYLRDAGERSQTDIAQALSLDASTVTRMVSRLEAQQLVHRRGSTTDGRAVVISLTPRGAELGEQVLRLWVELERTTAEGMSERERTDLHRALEDVRHRLQGARRLT
jgi:DNA-binding MarR family transcriptional regulator